jgi:ATP-dependent exoDNAse (exonuclease V) beta subunit
MTIHAAKGLEFPVVFVPELERPFNYGVSDSVYLDALTDTSNSTEIAAGIKGIHPEKNF